jgi:hypothetical protein
VGVAGSNPVIPTKLKATTDKGFSEKTTRKKTVARQKNRQDFLNKQSEINLKK